MLGSFRKFSGSIYAKIVLAIVITLTTLQWESFLMAWLSVWLVSVCLSWLFLGVFEIIGLAALLIILPVVQYQSVLSGSMMPISAAPEWLELIGNSVPFDAIGGAYRAVIFGSDGIGLKPFLIQKLAKSL